MDRLKLIWFAFTIGGFYHWRNSLIAAQAVETEEWKQRYYEADRLWKDAEKRLDDERKRPKLPTGRLAELENLLKRIQAENATLKDTNAELQRTVQAKANAEEPLLRKLSRLEDEKATKETQLSETMLELRSLQKLLSKADGCSGQDIARGISHIDAKIDDFANTLADQWTEEPPVEGPDAHPDAEDISRGKICGRRMTSARKVEGQESETAAA